MEKKLQIMEEKVNVVSELRLTYDLKSSYKKVHILMVKLGLKSLKRNKRKYSTNEGLNVTHGKLLRIIKDRNVL